MVQVTSMGRDYKMENILQHRGGRSAQHRKLSWFAFNTLQRANTRSHSKIFVKQQGAAKLRIPGIQTMLEEGDRQVVFKYGNHYLLHAECDKGMRQSSQWNIVSCLLHRHIPKTTNVVTSTGPRPIALNKTPTS